MKPNRTWIVVADGDQAKIFAHDGPGKGLQIVNDLSLEQAHLRAGEIMADRPGRASNPSGPGSRAAVDYRTDPVDARERAFVAHLAEVLDERHREGAFERLLIAAAPAALGDLRHAMSDGLKGTIIAELPKDLTNMPTARLSEHLEQWLAV